MIEFKIIGIINIVMAITIIIYNLFIAEEVIFFTWILTLFLIGAGLGLLFGREEE